MAFCTAVQLEIMCRILYLEGLHRDQDVSVTRRLDVIDPELPWLSTAARKGLPILQQSIKIYMIESTFVSDVACEEIKCPKVVVMFQDT